MPPCALEPLLSEPLGTRIATGSRLKLQVRAVASGDAALLLVEAEL